MQMPNEVKYAQTLFQQLQYNSNIFTKLGKGVHQKLLFNLSFIISYTTYVFVIVEANVKRKHGMITIKKNVFS